MSGERRTRPSRRLRGARNEDPASADQIALVIERIAKLFALHVADLTGPSRAKDIVRARQLAMWCCRRLVPQPTLPAIAQAFGRDHTSVLDAVRVADRLLQEYPALSAALRA